MLRMQCFYEHVIIFSIGGKLSVLPLDTSFARRTGADESVIMRDL